MQKLIDGHRLFFSHVFPQKQAFYRDLAAGQNPKYLFITCSDSRVQPTEFLSASAGELFADRSLGNVVPAPGSKETEATAVVEYAVVALGVEHIIVCGHSNCGAVKALLDPASLATMPIVAEWLANTRPTLEVVERKYGHLEGRALLDAAIRENVLVQLDHLRRQPCVAPRLAAGRIGLHGWVYEFERGRVVAYDQRVDEFVPLAEAYH
jgi:carbonic anhydrase